jgi:hypothetical protein
LVAAEGVRPVTSFGDQRDVKIRKVLEDDGYCVGSRRKIPGPGDLLAVKALTNLRPLIGYHHEVVLIEVKATQQSPWERFSGAERAALAQEARTASATAAVAWWPAHGDLRWFVVVDEHLGTPWRGPGTMVDELYEPPPQTRRRAKGPRPVPPRAAGPGNVGARAARRGPGR